MKFGRFFLQFLQDHQLVNAPTSVLKNNESVRVPATRQAAILRANANSTFAPSHRCLEPRSDSPTDSNRLERKSSRPSEIVKDE